MLISLALKFFRRHENLELDFKRGLNVLRGPNEIGKTTITEAFCYALYGAAALRNSLAETVTWGHKESELRVVAKIRVGDVDYTFKRSKNGAECFTTDRQSGVAVGGMMVTGQKEVSAFAAELLGADVKVASNLMLAGQNDLRGALDNGPTAVSSLIGKLADFDLIDTILENAHKKLSLGAEQPVRERIARCEADVAMLRAAVPDPAEVEAYRPEIVRLQAQLAAADAAADTLQLAQVDAHGALEMARRRHQDYDLACQQVGRLQRQIGEEGARLRAAEEEAAGAPDPARISDLRAELARLSAEAEHLKAYQAFLALPAYPEVFWDQPKASYEAEVKKMTAEREAANLAASEARGRMRTLEAQKITSGKCPTCGHAARSDEHVAEHNAKLQGGIDEAKAEYDKHAKEAHRLGNELNAMQFVEMQARKIVESAARIHAHVELDESVYPPRVSWRGAAPRAVDTGPVKAELARLESAERAAAQAQGRVDAYRASKSRFEKDLREVQAATQALLPLPELQPLQDAYDESYRRYAELSNAARAVQGQIGELEKALAGAERARKEALDKLAAAEDLLDFNQGILVELLFNNQLVKDLRAMKPKITDYLWSTVLAAVGNFFSQMRGEQSVVTKDETGFKVNGRSVDSLSGSTLDALALSIRIALTKTFIPHASFLVLDEPAHGCDNNRTSNVLGFLAGVGFEQTLLASHDELSESVADHVINLGA